MGKVSTLPPVPVTLLFDLRSLILFGIQSVFFDLVPPCVTDHLRVILEPSLDLVMGVTSGICFIWWRGLYFGPQFDLILLFVPLCCLGFQRIVRRSSPAVAQHDHP